MAGCLDRASEVLAISGIDHGDRLVLLAEAMVECRERFKNIETNFTKDKPLIGVVGEIFCRLNTYSNDDLIRKVEEHGGEAWLSGIAGWVWYTNTEQKIRIRRDHTGLEAWN
jgi:predicted nucleotide-binding protein (sugar kinase/HSP70/actin superfamily)